MSQQRINEGREGGGGEGKKREGPAKAWSTLLELHTAAFSGSQDRCLALTLQCNPSVILLQNSALAFLNPDVNKQVEGEKNVSAEMKINSQIESRCASLRQEDELFARGSDPRQRGEVFLNAALGLTGFFLRDGSTSFPPVWLFS